MSTKRNKRKRKRFIIIITALLILLFLAIIFNEKKENGPNEQDTSVPPIEKPTEKDEMIGISVSPESYLAYTGEEISVDLFKMTAIYKSGKTEEVNNTISYSTDSSIITIENDNIIINDNALTADNGLISFEYNRLNAYVTIDVFNSLEDNINDEEKVTNISAYDVIVNKSRNLPSDYVPEDLVSIDDLPKSLQNPEVNQLRKVAYEALKELFAKAKDEKSFELYARSGYRSYKTQQDLYNSYVTKHGQAAADKFSAKPGQSEHQTGLAMDITCEAMNYLLDDTFFDTEEGKWVADNAHEFGFIIRYPKGKEDITGYQYEPWHLRYVGLTLAKEIYEKGLTLEEYFEQ